MKYYVISIIICLLIGLVIDLLAVPHLNVYQDFGVLALALGIGLFLGCGSHDINDV